MQDTPESDLPLDTQDWLKVYSPEKLDFIIRSCGFVRTLKIFDTETITDHDIKVMCRVLRTSYENLITELEKLELTANHKFNYLALLYGCRTQGIERTLAAIPDLQDIDEVRIRVICRTIVVTQETVLDTLRDLMIGNQNNK